MNFHPVQQADGSHALERTHAGPRPASESGHRLSRLEGAPLAAASGEKFQAQHRSPVLSQVARHCGFVFESPRERPVLSLDEKSQIQALDRTQPILPLRPGTPSGKPTITLATARRRCSPR